MAKYALTMEINTVSDDAFWWEVDDNIKLLQVFESFEEAKAEMRNTVTRVIKECDFFPLKNGLYLAEDCPEYTGQENAKKVGEIIGKTVVDPDYFYENPTYIRDTPLFDRWYAFVSHKDLIRSDYFGKSLIMNIHNMTDELKTYYFKYVETDDYGKIVNGIVICLLNDAEKDDKV